MKKIVKVDCDKWIDRLIIFAKGGLIALWGLLTFGLVYGCYIFFNDIIIHNYESCFDRFTDHVACWPGTITYAGIFLSLVLLFANIVNFYFIFKVIYNNQSMIKFECGSRDQ